MPASPSALCPASDGGGAGETMLCQASLNQMLENVFTIKKHLLDSVDCSMGRKHPMNRMSWHEVIRGARWPLNLIRLVDIGTEEGYRSRPRRPRSTLVRERQPCKDRPETEEAKEAWRLRHPWTLQHLSTSREKLP